MSYVLVKNNDWTTVTCNNVQVSIPKVWQTAKLRDSVKSYIGGDYGDDTDGEDKSEVDVYTLHVFNTNYEKAIAKRYLRTSKLKGRALDVGDILLEKCGGSPKNPVGRMYQLTKASTRPRTAVNFITILKLVECVDAKYLYAHLRYLYKNGVTRLYEQKTTGIANLKTEDFLNHEIQKPSSLVEQTAIANILSDQEALIAQYDNLIALHEKRFAYLSDELLSGRVRLHLNAGNVIFRKNDVWTEVEIKSNHFQVPDAWAAKQLSNVLIVESIRIENKVKKQDVLNKGKYIAISQEIEFSCGYSDGSPLVATAQKPHILFGDHNCSLKFVVEPYVLAGDGVKVLTSVNNAKFLFYALKNLGLQPIGYQRHFIQLKENVALIPPIEEQTLIANVLSDQEALIAQYKKLRDAEKKRFDWLSDALLSGTYRVKVEA